MSRFSLLVIAFATSMATASVRSAKAAAPDSVRFRSYTAASIVTKWLLFASSEARISKACLALSASRVAIRLLRSLVSERAVLSDARSTPTSGAATVCSSPRSWGRNGTDSTPTPAMTARTVKGNRWRALAPKSPPKIFKASRSRNSPRMMQATRSDVISMVSLVATNARARLCAAGTGWMT